MIVDLKKVANVVSLTQYAGRVYLKTKCGPINRQARGLLFSFSGLLWLCVKTAGEYTS